MRQFNPLLLKNLEYFDGQLHEVFVDTSSLSVLAVFFQEDIEELGIVPCYLLHIDQCQSNYISSKLVQIWLGVCKLEQAAIKLLYKRHNLVL